MHKLFQEYYNKHYTEINSYRMNLPMNAKYRAVIVETRCVPDFRLIVKAHLRFVPDDYSLTVVCSETNKYYIRKELKGIYYSEVIVDLTFSEQEQKAAHLVTLHQYNRLLTSIDFWNKVTDCSYANRVLMFQTDSLLLKPLNDSHYVGYDGVGAKWKDGRVGNGGLSLRSVAGIYGAVCSGISNDGSINEDVFFCNWIKTNRVIASAELADTFSVESVFAMGSVGVHGITNWLSETECVKILTQYDTD